MLVPYQESATLDAKTAVKRLRQWRKGISWGKGMQKPQ
jgi:hypothetical protein